MKSGKSTFGSGIKQRATDKISVIGARETNLKNINIDFPHNEITAVVGVSGSGKSSLLFRTLADESHARHMLQLPRPRGNPTPRRAKVDRIEGLPFCQTVSQRALHRNSRSAVATYTGLHAIFRYLTREFGSIECQCGHDVESTGPAQLLAYLEKKKKGNQVNITAVVDREPLSRLSGTESYLADEKLQKVELQPLPGEPRKERKLKGLGDLNPNQIHAIFAPIASHRVIVKEREALEYDILRSFKLGHGGTLITVKSKLKTQPPIEIDTDLQVICGYCFDIHRLADDPLLSFNSAPERSGRCTHCEGLGFIEEVGIDALLSRPNTSVEDGCFTLRKEHGSYKFLGIREDIVRGVCTVHGDTTNQPFKFLKEETRCALLYGMGDTRILPLDASGKKSGAKVRFHGFIPALTKLVTEGSEGPAKEYARTFVLRAVCSECAGSRFDNDALAHFHYRGTRFTDLMTSTVEEGLEVLGKHVSAAKDDEKNWLLSGIRVLESLQHAGLGYISMDRSTSTLSGGELQRLKIASSLYEGVIRSCYILDEPSLGLHASDVAGLRDIVSGLRAAGNTLIIADHNPNMISVASNVITLGPGAGERGGDVVSVKPVAARKYSRKKLRKRIELEPNCAVKIAGANVNNLRHVDIEIPLGGLVCLTGVSGSGKSSYANQVLYPAVQAFLASGRCTGPSWKLLSGAHSVSRIERVGQQAIGTSVSSILATYLGVFDTVREKYASTELAQARGYSSSHFSFNRPEGRCPACRGRGVIMDDDALSHASTCVHCGGSRYIDAVLDVEWKGINIGGLLSLTIVEAVSLFDKKAAIASALKLLVELGLGHLQLGRSTLSLSGGEAQRLKLATNLTRVEGLSKGLIFILDEPTAGLYTSDVSDLLTCFDKIVAGGKNTLVVIEHNLDFISQVDWIIDFGPGAGNSGGNVIFSGTPEAIMKHPDSRTGHALLNIGKTAKTGDQSRKTIESDTEIIFSDRSSGSLQLATTRFLRALRRMEFVTAEDEGADFETVFPCYTLETRPTSFSAKATVLDCFGLTSRLQEILLEHIEFSYETNCLHVSDPAEALRVACAFDKRGHLGFSPITSLLETGEATADLAYGALEKCAKRGYEQFMVDGVAYGFSELTIGLLYEKDLFSIYVMTSPVPTSVDDAAELLEEALRAGQGWAVYLPTKGTRKRTVNLVTRPLSNADRRVGRQRLVLGLLDLHSDGGCPFCEGSGELLSFNEDLLFGKSKCSITELGFFTAEAARLFAPVHGRMVKTVKYFKVQGVIDLASARVFDKKTRIVLLYGYPWARFLTPGRSGTKDTDYYKWQGIVSLCSDRMHLSKDKAWRDALGASRELTICQACDGSGFDWQMRHSLVYGKNIPELFQTMKISDVLKHLKHNVGNDIDAQVKGALSDLVSSGLGALILGTRIRDMDAITRQKLRALALRFLHFSNANYSLSFSNEAIFESVSATVSESAKDCRIAINFDK